MKKGILILLCGALLGALGWQLYQRKFHPTLAQRATNAASQTRGAAAEAGGQAAASARQVGSALGDAGIIARIKGKYLIERDLPVLAISVGCEGGRVTLTGTLDSPDQAQRAARLARETGGVTEVVSQLKVRG